MSEDITGHQTGSLDDDHISLHLLCEEDFPWLLLWMTKESTSSLSLLLQTTTSSAEIIIVTGVLNSQARISLLTLYAAAFTRLKADYTPQPGEYSIQQLQLNPLVLNKQPVLLQLVQDYIAWIFAAIHASKVFWEIHQSDYLLRDLALKAGFRLSVYQGPPSFQLYEHAG